MLDDWRRETGREWFPSFCLPRAFCCVSEAPCREKRAGEAERELLFVVPLQLVSLVFSLCTDPCHLFGVVDDWLRTQAVSVFLPAFPPSLSLSPVSLLLNHLGVLNGSQARRSVSFPSVSLFLLWLARVVDACIAVACWMTGPGN